ncbi:hypothetical protein [Streptomyces fagopyri]
MYDMPVTGLVVRTAPKVVIHQLADLADLAGADGAAGGAGREDRPAGHS